MHIKFLPSFKKDLVKYVGKSLSLWSVSEKEGERERENAGVIGYFELSDVGARNQTQVSSARLIHS